MIASVHPVLSVRKHAAVVVRLAVALVGECPDALLCFRTECLLKHFLSAYLPLPHQHGLFPTILQNRLGYSRCGFSL